MKKITVIAVIGAIVIWFTGCYKNRYDIADTTLESIRTISMRKDVVPIVTAGGCGCHNSIENVNRNFLFSTQDTIFYSTIVGKAKLMEAMAKGGPHPAEGSIAFTPSQAKIIIAWVEQGAKDDGEAPPILGEVGYVQNIVPVVKSSCSGSSCHGGVGPVLDYTLLKNNESKLRTMMNSQGASGHNPVIVISNGTANTFLAWMNQGFKP